MRSEMNTNLPGKVFFLFVVAGFVFFADQLCKWTIMELVYKRLQDVPPAGFFMWLTNEGFRLAPVKIEILPFFNLVMVWNEGISFGLFSGSRENGLYIITGVSAFISFCLFIWALKTDDKHMTVALAVIIGGALGNICDRLRFGAVADFFDFHLAGWHYPAFNIADSCIVLGALYIVYRGFRLEKKS